jgi:poly(A) polymerase
VTFAHLDAVLAEVHTLGQSFVDAGYRLFLVGGIVRDQLLDAPLDGSSDIDLTTDALPDAIKEIVLPFADDLWTQGEKFGTIGLRAGRRDFEITTHRAESYSSDSRKPVVSFGDDITTDLSRRDFTVNAMAIELPDGELVDPYRGADDLRDRVLRTPLSAELSFTDDPLRMLRAARFASKFSLTVDDSVRAAAASLHERLRIVAIERIGVEVRKLLTLPDPSVGLGFLADTGLLAEVLSYSEPERIAAIAPKLDGVLPIIAPMAPNWHTRLAALGLGIFDTAEQVQAMSNRLRLSRDDERTITAASRSALAVLSGGRTNPELRRWRAACLDEEAAFSVARARADDPTQVDEFEQALQALAATEDMTEIRLLDGDTIMEVLATSPGPVVGQAHAFLRDRYFETGPSTDTEQTQALAQWWADQQR